MFQAEFGSVWSEFILKVLPNSDKSVLKLSQFVLYILIGLLGWKSRFSTWHVSSVCGVFPSVCLHVTCSMSSRPSMVSLFFVPSHCRTVGVVCLANAAAARSGFDAYINFVQWWSLVGSEKLTSHAFMLHERNPQSIPVRLWHLHLL